MYLPQHFAETRPAELHRLIAEHPLGMLVTNGANGLDANHLPFELDPARGPHGTLMCHVARANPVWQELSDGDAVLVAFRGPHAYVSPNWYPSKQETHAQVPTWNYMVVNAHGRVTIRDDAKYLRGVVGRLTKTHEASQAKPWTMGESSPEFIETMLKSIVAIDIEIDRLVGKAKLGQNKLARDVHGAADGLESQGNIELAHEMRTRAANRGE